jgi:hypothetical protein
MFNAYKFLSRWFLSRFILLLSILRKHISPKRRLTLTGVHGVISQKTVYSWPLLKEPKIQKG